MTRETEQLRRDNLRNLMRQNIWTPRRDTGGNDWAAIAWLVILIVLLVIDIK